MARNRSNHEAVVVGLFTYASDARHALIALREQRFTSDQIAAAFRDKAASSADWEEPSAPVRESSKWFGQLRQLYHGEEHIEGARQVDIPGAVKDALPTGFEAMLAQLPLSSQDALILNRALDRGAAIVTVKAGSRNPEARALLEQRGAQIASGYDLEPTTRDPTPASVIKSTPFTAPLQTEPGHIQLFGEVLRVRKEKVSGDVQVRKESVTRMETVQVPVTREELVVERSDGTGCQDTEDAIRIPLSEERLHIDKDTVLREEYKVGKREVTQNESVTDSVRRERLLIDEASVNKDE